MNRPDLYYKTVNLLLDAYNTGELKHGDCEYCAVGNICKEASEKTGIGNSRWNGAFCTFKNETGDSYVQMVRGFIPTNIALALINATGYTVEELKQVEWAFETSIPINQREYYTEVNIKQGQYIGLCAVLEVLKDIHSAEVEDQEQSKQKLNHIAKQFDVVLV